MKKIGHQFWCFSCCFTTKRAAPHPACPRLSISTCRALFHPLQKPKILTGFAIFFETFPTSSQRIYISLLVALGSQAFVPIRRCRGNFLSWKCSCRWHCVYPCLDPKGDTSRTPLSSSRGISAPLQPFDSITQMTRKDCEQQRTYREQWTNPAKWNQEMRLDMKSLSVQSKNTSCLLREYQNLEDFFFKKKVKHIKVLQQVLTHKVSSMSVHGIANNCNQIWNHRGWSSAVWHLWWLLATWPGWANSLVMPRRQTVLRAMRLQLFRPDLIL